MSKSSLALALAAAVGAVLPYTSDLVSLLHLPPPLANALCAAVVAAAYKLIPAKAAPVEGAK
jgi:hypothetical protein